MISNDECLQSFISEYSIRLGDRTLYNYQKSVEQMLVYFNKPVDEITSRDIRNWMQSLGLRNKQATVRKKLTGVRLFYRYCFEEEFITHNPVVSVHLPELEEYSTHYLLNDQLTELRKLVEGRLQERAVIEVLYTTGVRISEMAALKMEDIVWSERIMHVRKGKGKKDRIVLFTQSCEVHLKAYLKERHDDLPFVFLNVQKTGPIHTQFVGKNFRKYKKELGIHVSPHTLRHTFAAHLAMKGMPLVGIQALLGHARPEYTQRYAVYSIMYENKSMMIGCEKLITGKGYLA